VTAVQGLFVQNSPQLRGLILGLMPDFAAVDDIMQETFLTITRKAHTFTLGTQFMAWAATVARYETLKVRQREGKKVHWLSDESLEALAASHADSPAESEAQIRALERCVSQLAPQAKRAMELRYQKGHKAGEVARIMGWTAEALYVALSRARSTLRVCVERQTAAEEAAS
jgi:RNA polymerase sigma-70 factor (ECF subfamily)